MELQRLVTRAKLGDTRAFDALVRLCQRKVLAVALRVCDGAAAEDATQVAFLTAWQRLGDLRDAEAFPGWVAVMARNEALRSCRRQGRESGEFDWDNLEEERSSAQTEPEHSPWSHLVEGLEPAQATLLELKYAAGLSHAQIGAVLGIPEARVKSRLYTLRQRLLKRWGSAPPNPTVLLEEKIMTELETRLLGAHVFERLSLTAQVRWAQTVLASGEWDAKLLAEIGAIDRGPEFLALYGTRNGLGELIAILNHTDRFTESRVIGHLEKEDPAGAETIKQNMFVFEDICLCDPPALRLLVDTADVHVLATALVGTERRLRNDLLAALPEDLRARMESLMHAADGDQHQVAAAQLAMVNHFHDLEHAGRLKVVRPPEGGPGWPVITVA